MAKVANAFELITVKEIFRKLSSKSQVSNVAYRDTCV